VNGSSISSHLFRFERACVDGDQKQVDVAITRFARSANRRKGEISSEYADASCFSAKILGEDEPVNRNIRAVIQSLSSRSSKIFSRVTLASMVLKSLNAMCDSEMQHRGPAGLSGP
jgi:hypothetical protein